MVLRLLRGKVQGEGIRLPFQGSRAIGDGEVKMPKEKVSRAWSEFRLLPE